MCRGYDETERYYGDFIGETNGGLPRCVREAGWRRFASAWKVLDEVADYLLTAKDTPKMNIPYAYGEKGLRRLYFDSRRDCNVVSLCDSGLEPMVDDSEVQFTDQELAEIASYRSGFVERFHDRYFTGEFLNYITDPLERAIALDFYHGERKRDVERRYDLSERRVRTITKHLAKVLKDKWPIC